MRYASFAFATISLAALFTVSAQAQEDYRNEAAVSAIGSFQQSTSGNGINQTSTDSGGVLFSYRYFFTNHQGIEANYGYSRFSQQFSPLGTNSALFAPFGIPADTHEATAAYVFRFGLGSRIRPFLTAGTGALVFRPDSFTIGNTNGSTFATPDFVYGAGADISLSRHISFRLGYRGHVYQAPNFGIPALKTDSVAHMAEPFGGLTFRF